jgi:hypothetical protein
LTAAFYLDEDVTEALATPLRGRGHQVTTTTAAGRKGTRDHEQLWFAAQRGWILITVNRRDFESLHGAWLLWSVPRSHAGIIVLYHPSEEELEAIAQEIDDLATDPAAFLLARSRVGRSGPTVDPGGTMANHLFRRWRDGRWDCVG